MKRLAVIFAIFLFLISCSKDKYIAPIVGHWQTIKVISPKIEYDFFENGALCVTDTVEHCNLVWEFQGWSDVDRTMNYQIRDDKTGMLMETWHCSFVNLIIEVTIVPTDPDLQPYITYLEH